MNSHIEIVAALGSDLRKKIIRKSILSLQKMPGTLSGDDTGLENSWDEICVQMQSELSIYWDTYDEVSKTFVSVFISELKDYEKFALWLETSEGWEWASEDVNTREQDPPIYDGNILENILSELYAEACHWSNKKIRAYFENRY